jgi:FkbM family methyltransferase
LHSRFGSEPACGVKTASGTIFVDLSDIRFLQVLQEVIEESSEHRILRALLKPGDTFVDIGANHGSYSLIASQIVGSNGLVVAFEPQQHLAALIQRSLHATSASEFKVISAGCSDHVGKAEFFIPAHASGSAGVFAQFSAAGQHRTTMIELTTLDGELAKLPVRGSLFLKLDVEGSEYNALKGARETLVRHHPAILMELNPSSAQASGHSVQQLLDLLSELGYDSICEMDEFPERRSINGIDVECQRNVLLLHGKK